MTIPKSLERWISKNPEKVLEVGRGRIALAPGYQNGWERGDLTVTLKDGSIYVLPDEATRHIVCGRTAGELLDELKTVIPCDCEACEECR